MRSVSKVALLGLVMAVVLSPAVLAQSEDQVEDDAAPLIIYTRYPAIEVGIGSDVSFTLELVASGVPRLVSLSVEELPDGWSTTFRGGGDIVNAAYVETHRDRSVILGVEPPEDVVPGVYSFVVVASDEEVRAEIPIELVIKEKLPPSLEIDVELPTLRGSTDATFTYSTIIKNKGDEDVSVNLFSDAPSGLRTVFKVTGREVTSVPVSAGNSERVAVEVQPLGNVPAGTHVIRVLAQGGAAEAYATLSAEIVGAPVLRLRTPDGRLSGSARAGEQTSFTFVVANDGTAPGQNIAMSASPPSGWTVEFDPARVEQIPSGGEVEVAVRIRPDDQTIAGDYVVSVAANPQEGPSPSADLRVTVLTSTLWGVVGVAIIAVAVGVVGLAVMRFGRR